MHKNKSQLLLLLNRMPANAAYDSVATTRWKVMIPLSVTVWVHQRRSRDHPKRSQQGIKRERRKPTILKMEGEEILIALMGIPIM